MRSSQSITIEASGADTFYSEPIRPAHDAARIALQARRVSGDGGGTLTLQGGWDSLTGDDYWVDLGYVASVAGDDIVVFADEGVDAILATFSAYRVEFVADGEAAVEVRIVSFG